MLLTGLQRGNSVQSETKTFLAGWCGISIFHKMQFIHVYMHIVWILFKYARGTLGNVLNVWHTEEWAQRRYPVHCSLHTTSPGHWQLRWRDHCMECGVWTYTVSLQDPSVSTEQQYSLYANISVNFQWIMITILLILSQIYRMTTWNTVHKSLL